MAWLLASQNILMSQQNLIFSEAQLQKSNAKTLAEVGIVHQSIIELKKMSTPGKEVFARNSKVRRHTPTNAGPDWVSYLYWEAETNTTLSDSSPAPLVMSVADQVEPFLPLSASVESKNSVLLSLKDLPSYLDRTLLALGLHTEARTSFITYWLPSFNKFPHIALRFVPQASYEQAAPLDISPVPDVVTRVFMVFRGIKDLDVSEWKEAIELVQEEPSFWCQVIGVNLALQKHWQDVFKVLEWGGMEMLF
ncbi:hypothetical protein C8J56DRAFT_1081559 [Mycena floridula]|nr:hypothetical protein C8J56DRAFT_1081559 [Mycena floridula]